MNNDPHLQRHVLLEELLPRWLRWLSLRYRPLAALHPEIVQDASADLVEYLPARLAWPSDPRRIREPRSDQPDTALRLGHFFGTSAEFWLNLQKLYELRVAEQDAGEAIRVLPRLSDRVRRSGRPQRRAA
jgi:hypothetical protein